MRICFVYLRAKQLSHAENISFARNNKPAPREVPGDRTIFRTDCEGKRVKRVKVALRRKKIRDIWPAREWSHLTTYLPFLRLMNSNPFDISPRLNSVPGRHLIFHAAVFRHVFPSRAHATRYRSTCPFFNLFP